MEGENQQQNEEQYPLVYNMWLNNCIINVNDGGVLIMQTGKPEPPPIDPPGSGDGGGG